MTYRYIDQYANETDENNKEIILTEAIDCLHEQEEKRTKELYDFIDDFITSHEYQDYVKAKKKIMTHSASTQFNANDIIVEIQRRSVIEKYPLTAERKKMCAFQEQFEKYAERLKNLDVRRKQEMGIQAMRAKIDAVKIHFECTRDYAQRKRNKRDERLLHHYSSKVGTNLSMFSLKSRLRILERVKAHHRALCTRREKKRQNIINIIEKLLFTYNVKKGIKKLQSKTYDYKVKRKEKIIKDMEVVGTKIELIDSRPVTDASEKAKAEKKAQSEKISSLKKKKDTATDTATDKINKKEKKEKEGKKPKDKPAKGKIEKKTGKPEATLELPFVPVVNPREKIFGGNIDQMLDLVEEFRTFDSELENKDMMMRERDEYFILGDTGIASRPKSILFQNYEEEKTYYKVVIITNVAPEIRKLRFLKFSFENRYDEVMFDVENFGIRKLYVGCHVKFWVSFKPCDATIPFEGKMQFLSYDLHRCQYYLFEMTVKCLPKYSNLRIYPKTVDFGRTAVWKAKSGEQSKSIKMENKGFKSCTVYIHKMSDPLDIEAILHENYRTENVENKENITPISENSVASDKAELECYIQEILCSCIDNIDNNFCFEETFFTLLEDEEARMKVTMKNVDYVGNYFEKFTVDVYERFQDGELDLVGCQEITLVAETTGHFLFVNPEILDFEICHINTRYQLNFELFNSSTQTQAVSMRFPTDIADMIQADVSTVYLPPQGKRVMWLKLLPREYIYRDGSIYFDKNTSILEFPIHLYIVSKNYRDHPPVKIPVYAILSNTEDVTIRAPIPTCSLTNFLDTVLLDMKTCSVYETIWTEIYIQNNSALTQFCGFLDLPPCVSLEPNQGFFKLYPSQHKVFQLYFSPEIRDFPSYPIGSLKNNQYFFKLKIDTISNIGKTKKTIPAKKLKSSLDLMLQELENIKIRHSQDSSLFNSMTYLSKEIAREISHSMVNKGITSTVRIVESTDVLRDIHGTKSEDNISSSFDCVLNYHNFVIFETTSRKVIWCKVSLKRPMLEFSHQSIEFPDTPCGSYSVMEIGLTAVRKVMEADCVGDKRKKNEIDYTADFQIAGESEEITIEPKCGTLRAGQSIKITLLAKPNVPKEIVEQTARSIKFSEIYQMKLKEYHESKSRKGAKKEENKETKGKERRGRDKKNEKSKTDEVKKPKKNEGGNKDVKKINEKEDGHKAAVEDLPTFVITDKEMEFDFLDLYPAEMVYWRNMDAYYIKAKFTCRIDYTQGIKSNKKPDWIHLNAICKVTRPDFITNLNLQRLDFGKCTVGTNTTKEIMLQNINYDDIEIKTSLLHPVDYFSIPFIRDLRVPPEHSLKLPIRFSPASTHKVEEYLEIRSNATVLPLILCGQGVVPNINITPNFTVFRLEAKYNRFTELSLKMENASESPVNIRLEKIFEIEGRLADYGKHAETVEMDPKDAKSTKDKKVTENKSAGKEKGPKYSDSLTDRELKAIDHCFSNVAGDSYFDLSITETMYIQPNSHDTVIIYFGDPESLQNRKSDKPKKGGKQKEDKNAKAEEAESKKSSDKKGGDVGKQYITQYNVFIGNTFIKGIVLLCTKL